MVIQDMQTIEKQKIAGYQVAGISVQFLSRAIILALLFLGLCVIVFAGETNPKMGNCDPTNGPCAILNLSRHPCETTGQISDRFPDDTSVTITKIVEKCPELRKIAEGPEADPRTGK